MVLGWRKKGASVQETPVVTDGAEIPTEGVASGVDRSTPNEGALELEKFQKAHKWDLYMDTDRLDIVDAVVASGDVEKEAALEESLLEEDSPYSEVRISVSTSPIASVCSILTFITGPPNR